MQNWTGIAFNELTVIQWYPSIPLYHYRRKSDKKDTEVFKNNIMGLMNMQDSFTPTKKVFANKDFFSMNIILVS